MRRSRFIGVGVGISIDSPHASQRGHRGGAAKWSSMGAAHIAFLAMCAMNLPSVFAHMSAAAETCAAPNAVRSIPTPSHTTSMPVPANERSHANTRKTVKRKGGQSFSPLVIPSTARRRMHTENLPSCLLTPPLRYASFSLRKSSRERTPCPTSLNHKP